jgi:Protein of unknown function (DUF4232)
MVYDRRRAVLVDVFSRQPSLSLFGPDLPRSRTRRPLWRVCGVLLGNAVLIGPLALAGVAGATKISIGLSVFAHAAPTRCRSGQLRVNWDPAQSSWAATGTMRFTYRFTNTSGPACTLQGYPELQLRSVGGKPLPTTPFQQTYPGNPGRQPGEVVVLGSGGHAWFVILFGTFGNLQCPRSATLAVTPPGDTQALLVTGYGGQLQPYGGTQQQGLYCGGISVSPVRARPSS